MAESITRITIGIRYNAFGMRLGIFRASIQWYACESHETIRVVREMQVATLNLDLLPRYPARENDTCMKRVGEVELHH